ncbi:MAG: hypothetical protein NT085_02015 [candidate division SR1 bacterium]|nr:hypothetical protein [candidate division SR1 bacterium]
MKLTLNNGTHVYVVCHNNWLDNLMRKIFGLTPIVPIPVHSFGYSLPRKTDVKYVSKQYKKGKIHRLEDVQKFVAKRLQLHKK